MDAQLSIGTSAIRQFDGLFSLNDLHKASGGEAKNKPSNFLRVEQTQSLIEEINQFSDLRSALKVVNGGDMRGTYACKELVIAYAAWISPAFHLRVLRVFLESIEPVRERIETGWIDPQRKLHLRRLVEHRACYLNRSAQKIWSEVRLVTGAGSIHFLSQQQYEQAVAYLGGFPLRGQQIERFPVTVSGADIHNFSSFMKVFRQIVDDADFLRDMAQISGSSKMMSLWSLIDSANFMSGSAQRMEAKLIGVAMESHDSIARLTRG